MRTSSSFIREPLPMSVADACTCDVSKLVGEFSLEEVLSMKYYLGTLTRSFLRGVCEGSYEEASRRIGVPVASIKRWAGDCGSFPTTWKDYYRIMEILKRRDAYNGRKG